MPRPSPQTGEERPKRWPLPAAVPPLGMSRTEAAAYIGVSTSLFDMMVRDGRMPGPKRINARTVWNRLGLERAFAALPGDDDDGANEWDE